MVGKSLTIQGDPGAFVQNVVIPAFGLGFMGPAVTISGLTADQSVVLRGIDIECSYAEPIAALKITGCEGPVHVEEAVITASAGPAVRAHGCDSVTLQGCTVESLGGFLPDGAPAYDPMPGLDLRGSNVFLHRTDLTGSAGYDTLGFFDPDPGDGGPGAYVDGGLLHLSSSTLSGGQGGDYSEVIGSPGCVALGDGGVGLEMNEAGGVASQVVLVASSIVGGLGGTQDPDCMLFPDRQAGADQIVTAGTVVTPPGPGTDFGWNAPVREGDPLTLQFEGPPGQDAYVFYSAAVDPGVLFAPALVLHVDLQLFQVSFRGVVPPGGSFHQVLSTPSLPPGFSAVQVTGQAVYADASGTPAVSGASVTTVLQQGL